MRMILLLLFFSLFGFSAFATIRTVSNLDAAAQFSTIQAACDASQSGDSIYVLGSTIEYSGFTINNKKLAVFGPGWSPFVGNIVFSTCNLTGVGASGSEIHGLSLYQINILTPNINDVIIYRNKINQLNFRYCPINNFLVEGNWFTSFVIDCQSSSASNTTIRNNIFMALPGGSGFYGLNGTNLIIDHNLFYSGSNLTLFINSASSLIISNNIFNKIDASGTSFSTFNNNITYSTSNDIPWTVNNNINAGGNIAGTNPQMAAQSSVDIGIYDPLLDFTIASGPANKSGSDGLDMGLLYDKGLVTNWTRCRAANLPYITEFNVTDQNISTNSYIHFNAKAKSN